MVECAENECASRDTGVQRNQINKYIQYGDEVVGRAIYRWAMYRYNDL
jgi:hypothetical protein